MPRFVALWPLRASHGQNPRGGRLCGSTAGLAMASSRPSPGWERCGVAKGEALGEASEDSLRRKNVL
jgi:hypothetical protein